MHAVILIVFVLTYVGMAIGRVPGLRLDRTGIALFAVAALLASQAVDPAFVGAAVEPVTLLLLFGLMIVSAQLAMSGFYDWVAARITESHLAPQRLLALTIAISGGLSAVLVNDIVVFAMTPLLVTGLNRRGLDPRPYLLGIAAASNAGSAATIIGNPQNILIAAVGDIGFWEFFRVCALPATVSLGVAYVVIARLWRVELSVPMLPARATTADENRADREQIIKGLVAVGALIVWFSLGLPREVGALAAAALLLASRKLATRGVLAMVDWPLLVLFACLFVVTGAVAATGAADGFLGWLQVRGLLPDRLTVLTPLSLVLSNAIGNVPAVVLITTFWSEASEGVLIALALLSTLAGNLLIVGSIANLIVAERAAASGVRLGFVAFARAGIPITLITTVLAVAWLALLGVIAI
ncbi:MAG: anion transporter [Alphaproteobacteria bacterium]|nr:anion transporter [Alphaproteobacteria bacterium]